MFELPVELTIVQVDECKEAFLEFVEQHDEVAINDSELIRIDTIGVQLLLSMLTYAISQHKTISWQINSPTIIDSIKSLGIDEPLFNQRIAD